MKKIIAVILIASTLFCLTACGSSEDRMHDLVQGNIDAIYRGKISDEYLKIIDSTMEIQKENYVDGLDTEAEFFCYYFGVIDSSYDESYDDVRDETKARIVDMYKQIYDKSKYEVKESVKQSDDNYTVQVIIEPIDIMSKTIEKLASGTYAPYEEFDERYADVNTDEMTDEEVLELLDNYINDYANIIIDCVLSLLPELGYEEAKSISVQVQADKDGIYSINDDDWNKIDDYMIYYP